MSYSNTIIGIYQIKNKTNNKIYVGSSLNIKRRFSDHRRLLKNNKHHSYKLQRAYNKYGESNFEFIVLEEVYFGNWAGTQYKLEILSGIEQVYLDRCGAYSKNNYNISSTAIAPSIKGCSKGAKALHEKYLSGDYVITKEKREKMSKSLKESSLFQATIKRINRKKRRKIYQYDLNGNFVREWLSITICGKNLNIRNNRLWEALVGKRLKIREHMFSYDKKNSMAPYKERLSDRHTYSKAEIKPVLRFDLEGNFITEFHSLSNASKELNMRRAAVAWYIRKEYEYLGFKLKFGEPKCRVKK